MARKRGIGKKFTKNLIKVSILLYLRDGKKSTSEIMEYLKKTFGISESKGVRLHLEWLRANLFLDKHTKIGIGTYWQWRKYPESFKKIVSFLHSNHDLVKDIVEVYPFEYMDTSDEEKDHLRRFFDQMKPEFYIHKYWYNTSYARSFFNEKTIFHFTKRAFKKYVDKGEFKTTSYDEFKRTVFGSLQDDTIVKLMHYSPSLVVYILNLNENYVLTVNKELPIGQAMILQIVLNDILIHNYRSHGGTSSAQYNIQKDPDSGAVKMNLTCSLAEPLEESNANS